jgi:hypothetical protein
MNNINLEVREIDCSAANLLLVAIDVFLPLVSHWLARGPGGVHELAVQGPLGRRRCSLRGDRSQGRGLTRDCVLSRCTGALERRLVRRNEGLLLVSDWKRAKTSLEDGPVIELLRRAFEAPLRPQRQPQANSQLTCLRMVRRRRRVLRMVSQLVDLVRSWDLLDELLGRPGAGRGVDGHCAHGRDTLVPDRVPEAARGPEAGAAVPVEGHHARRL